MHKHFAGFHAEVYRLFHDKLLLISFIVMFLIPILYGGFFLGSIWDPYGKTNDIPVAVVNEDQPAVVNGKTVTVGDQVVDNLKKNHEIDWQFVSADVAQKGLANGTYYMVITLPSDFSKNAASVTGEKPTESKVLYTVTPSKNYVGSIISNQAANSVVAQVKQSVTKEYATSLLSSIGELKTGMSEASDGAAQLASGSSQLRSGVEAYTTGVAQVNAGAGQLNNGLSQLHTGAAQLSNGLTQLSSQLPTATQITQLTNGVTSIQNGLSQLNTAVATPDPQLVALQTKVAGNAQAVAADVTAYLTAATESNTAIANVSAAVGIAAAATQPSVTVSTTDAAAVLRVLSLSRTFATDTGSLLTNLQSLTTALTTQQAVLKTSVTQLGGGMNTLAPNLLTVLGGYTSLQGASSQLTTGASQLSTGIAQASTGAESLSGGTSKLAANASELTAGASGLESGISTLAAALKNASNQLSVQPTGQTTADQLSNPVSGEKTEKGSVPNYGFALSPYVLALGLYVGALVFTVIYPVRDQIGRPHSALEWLLSKLTTASIMSVGQVAVLAGVMCGVLGLQPVHPFGFLALLLVTSWSFMSITNFLAISFNNPGRFVAMLLLVLQLGGSEGVFPLQTLPAFFQAINPWLPMTYAIRGLREAISGNVGGQTIWGNLAIVFLFGLVANALLLFVLKLHHNREFRRTGTIATD